MSELETKANAMLAEVSAQRNMALDRCAVMAGEIAALKAKVAGLEATCSQYKQHERSDAGAPASVA